MDKPPSRKEVGKILSELASPTHITDYGNGVVNGFKEGRLSAFKEMRDWAETEMEMPIIARNSNAQQNVNGRRVAFKETIEFAEAKMKEGK